MFKFQNARFHLKSQATSLEISDAECVQQKFLVMLLQHLRSCHVVNRGQIMGSLCWIKWEIVYLSFHVMHLKLWIWHLNLIKINLTSIYWTWNAKCSKCDVNLCIWSFNHNIWNLYNKLEISSAPTVISNKASKTSNIKFEPYIINWKFQGLQLWFQPMHLKL